jgi:uncharacterized protein YfaS (alpha-2-macroglobulin family)
MMGKTISVAAVLLAFGLWAASAQAVELDLTSEDEGQIIEPGDWVQVTVSVTNETDQKDIVHIDFDLTVEVAGETVFTGSAKRRMKLAAGETVEETIGTEVPVTPLTEEADVTIDATAKGRKSKTEASDSVYMTLVP